MDNIQKLDKKKVAKNAYRMIVESGQSIESIALSLNISERVIYYWQVGSRSPNIDHVYALSQFFGVSMESILL